MTGLLPLSIKSFRFQVVFLLTFFSLIAASAAQAQRIFYTEPEREDSKRTNFEIIGRLGDNYLIFKNNRADNAISVYAPDMKLVKREVQDYMPDRVINVDFVPYQQHAWMIFQHQKKNIVYCEGVKIGADGKKIGEVMTLDTTQVNFNADDKLYTTLVSEDKKKIMVLKINSKNPKNFVFTTVLMNDQLRWEDKRQIQMKMEEKNDYFTDFLLSNDGELVFGKFTRNNNSDNISKVSMVSKAATADSFFMKPLELEGKYLDEIKLRIDNLNRQVVLTSFFYSQRRGNIEGLYTAVYDQEQDSLLRSNAVVFNEELRDLAKGESSTKMAFNDYFIKTIIPRVDGGFFMASEAMYTSSRGGAWNRWDYLSWRNPWMYPSDFYFWNRMYSPWGWNSWRFNNSPATRYHADNIMIMSFNNKGEMEWSNVIPKNQFDDESDFLISYASLVSGGQIRFLFNEVQRRTLILSEQTVSPDGKIQRSPTIRNLDKGYEFMPRYAKQVSARQIIIPCFYRNYLCFARIDF